MNKPLKHINRKALEAYDPAEFTLIPLHRHDETRTKKGVSRKVGKAPLDFNWTTRDYDSRKTLARCLKENRNVGVRLTEEQLAIDVDPRNGGAEGFAQLCADAGLVEEDFPRVKTGSDGLHVLMSKPSGLPIVDTIPEYPGIEFKSRGRQIVAAGSVHPDTGKTYEWIEEPSFGLPPAPQALLELIKRPERSSDVKGGGQYTQEQIARALEAFDVTEFRDHDKWLTLMMACHHGSNGNARQEWIDWSTGDPLYQHDADIIGRRWDSLHTKKPGGITYRTLNYVLADHGAADLQVAPDVGDDFEGFEEPTETNGKYKTATIAELLAGPNPKWLIQGLMIERGLFEIYGRFKSGKTFWAIELACCIATGHDFFGSKVKKDHVLYVIAEGSRKLFAYRLQQWAKERGVDLKLLESNIDVLSVPVPIDSAKEVKAFLAANPDKRGLVVIDTLFRCMQGDVMKPQDFSKFVAGCDLIRRQLDCAVLFLHHQKRNDAAGGFGSVVGEASVDLALKVASPRKGVSTLRIEIFRDGDGGQPAWECRVEQRRIDDPTLAEGEVDNIGVLVFESRGTADVLRAMLQGIKDNEPDTVDDLARCLSVSKPTVERRLKQCRAKGWIAKGSLKLTTEGARQTSDFDEFDDEE